MVIRLWAGGARLDSVLWQENVISLKSPDFY